MAGCTDEQTFVTKSVSVGENVILTCNLQKSGAIEAFIWIKLVAGGLPEILGRAYSFLHDYEKIISRITTTKEPERFVLNITKTKPSDAGFYYCLKFNRFNITFLKGAFLSITEPDVTAIIQNFASDALYPGDLVTLQCSVLFDSGNKTCPEEHSVYWFRVGSDESHPNVIYTRGNSSDQRKKSPETRSPQKCVYSFSKNLSSSDSGTYYCAVATCGQILFGNGTKLDIEDVSPCDSKKTVLVLLCVALAISLIVIAFLIYAVVKTSCYCCNGNSQRTSNYNVVQWSTASDSVRPEDSVTLQCSLLYVSENKTCPGDHRPESDRLAVTQDPLSDPVRAGDSVTLQCSVLSDSGNKKCPEEHNVYWFKAKSDESHLSLIYANGNSSDRCEKSPETQKCVYNFFPNVDSSDAGTYYCAVATCGQIVFGNGTKLDIEVVSTCDVRNNTILFLLCVALAISLIVIAFLIYAIVKKSCDCCNAAANLQTNAAISSGNQQSRQANEDLVYSTPVFTRRKGGKAGRRNATAKDETIYTDVRRIL
ncbi:Ig kappa chain V region Mem5 [Channa argus]|uniref:Ig kappa chain V region Mem5 n=1 Tax=Channa argus TaxID=215402 RepID=A0A6G1PV40_CHAAH|nr:Ig kappa chain V region Mem5 [Channa argus]